MLTILLITLISAATIFWLSWKQHILHFFPALMIFGITFAIIAAWGLGFLIAPNFEEVRRIQLNELEHVSPDHTAFYDLNNPSEGVHRLNSDYRYFYSLESGRLIRFKASAGEPEVVSDAEPRKPYLTISCPSDSKFTLWAFYSDDRLESWKCEYQFHVELKSSLLDLQGGNNEGS